MNTFAKHMSLSLLVVAQILASYTLAGSAQKPAPAGISPQNQPPSQIETLRLPPVDHEKLRNADKQRLASDAPLRFAAAISVTVTPATHGTWDEPFPGLRRWRLRVISAPALSLNFGFSRYTMPPGGQLRMYTSDGGQAIRPFTAADNETHGQLWTPLLKGDDVIIEITLPAVGVPQLELQLSWVNHGYREFSRANPDKSASCNVDVACPEADNWRDELRAVAVYTLSGPGGSLVCSGALINNTAQDLTPYFLTASHCDITNANAPSMVVYWNYQNSTCRAPGSAVSGATGDGSLSQFNSGAILRAIYPAADMALVELDDPVDPSFNLFWAGWSRATSPPQSAVTIHHPNTEEKRISFENEPLAVTSYLSTTSPGDGNYLRVADWDLGTTEAGSSGAPLFNPAGHIVGHLRGGYAACNNNSADWFGRLAASWVGGGAPDSRLKDWLDPFDTGLAALDGTYQTPGFTLTAAPANRDVCVPGNGVYTVTVGSNLGYIDPVILSVSGQPAGSTVDFSANPVTPSGSAVLTVTNATVLTGSYLLNITGVSPTRTQTSTVVLNLIDIPGPTVPLAPANGAGGQSLTPLLEWSSVPQVASYTLEIATDAAFNSVVYTATFNSNSHSHIVDAPLLDSTTYYWRVTPQNACGDGSSSAIYSFSTLANRCRTPNLIIPDNNPAGITDTLIISDSHTITDLNVTISATHAFVGDLSFKLKHIETATEVTLVNRPFDTNRSQYCSGNNLVATLDDEAGSPVDTECAPGSPAIDGSFTPTDPLGIFDGEKLAGRWQLAALDTSFIYDGALVKWCLQPTLQSVSDQQQNVYLPLLLK